MNSPCEQYIYEIRELREQLEQAKGTLQYIADKVERKGITRLHFKEVAKNRITALNNKQED